VVLLFITKTTAVNINKTVANIVTSHMTILGRNKPKKVKRKLSPTEIRTVHKRSSIAFCEFHL
jgi:hypothetical protein